MMLKPSDRYLAELLGISEAEFEHFINEAQRIAAQSPRPAVTAGLDPFTQSLIINLVLTAGSMLLGSLFAPKAPGKPATVRTQQQQEPNKSQNKRYAPTSGFDSFQEVAKLQTTVPVIYARQEDINGKRYGGIRVNGLLLWSQMFSFRDHQMFRGIFLLGEGKIPNLDPQQFALGDTPLTSMNMPDAVSTATGSRYTIYYRPDGGRILQTDYLAGRYPNTDGGNAQLGGAADVYQVQSVGGAYRPDACMTSTPNTTITFGVYGGIPNNLGYRVNPTLRPTRTLNLVSKGDNSGDQIYDNEDDNESLCSIWKSRYHWSPRSIITSAVSAGGVLLGTGRIAVDAGGSINYTQFRKSDAKTTIVFEESGTSSNSDNGAKALAQCTDIAGAVAARQETADDTLILDALYRVGSCWAILEARTPANVPFISEASNDPIGGGNQIDYRFRVIRAGYLDIPSLKDINPSESGKQNNPPSARWGGAKQNNWLGLPDIKYKFDTATKTSQIYRLAVATFSIPRPCNIFELGIRSKVGLQVGGLCNFRDARSLTVIDRQAVGGHDSGDEVQSGDINVSLYQSGQVTRKETRYSFIRFAYRRNGDADFIVIPMLFGISGDTSQDVFNYVRFEMPGIEQWEVRIDPISGWEIRNNIATGNLAIINAGLSGLHRVAIAGVTVVYSGLAPKGRDRKDFRMTFFDADEDLGLVWTDEDGDSMIDSWGKLAEMFVYDEIQASCSNGPEHTITYINTITPNPTPPPAYDHLAILGLNIRSSTELQQLPQFSARVIYGINYTNLWPDALYDAATNDRYGTGDRMTPEQIDKASFDYSAAWARGRKYFYDALVESPVNLREWAAEMAPMFLLTFGEIGGQWYLTPAITFDPVPISALFTAGNIMEDTFRPKWLDADDRQPVRASATWREERYNLSASSPGIFPVEQEVLVEEVGLPANAQTLSLPMNEFCTSKQHAIDACKLVVRYRRYTTHRITFETTYDIEHAAVRPDAYIRVEMDELFVSGWNNGVCAANGQVTSTTALSDGSYNVIAWNGNANTAPVSATLVIRGGSGNLPGYVFAVVENQPTVNTYRVERVAPLEDGRFTITAAYAPTNPAGVLLMAADWDSPSAWRISP